jgi:hypothetical protein
MPPAGLSRDTGKAATSIHNRYPQRPRMLVVRCSVGTRAVRRGKGRASNGILKLSVSVREPDFRESSGCAYTLESAEGIWVGQQV